ncbi:hypothetical protein A2U01_0090932, partial [Trifolium medium]|nr:hypothetical protein [Trifolium medium]
MNLQPPAPANTHDSGTVALPPEFLP